MEILYILIPLAVVLMAIAVGFFLWTVRSGQYEDLEGPAYRILMDDDDPMIPSDLRSGSTAASNERRKTAAQDDAKG